MRLDHLVEGYAGDPGPHESCDGLRFVDVDLTGRDLTGAMFTECELVGVRANEAQLRASRLVETRLERLDAPVLHSSRTTWHEVRLESSRLGAVEMYESELRNVAITGCKLSYLNLRGANLRDVLFTDCVIDELDLDQATAERVAFHDCRIDTLQVHGARLTDVDLRGADLSVVGGLDSLRGAVIDAEQLLMLASAFAQHLGVRVVD